jgi:hypothetical protein
MRKERLIVPVLAGAAVIWAAAQFVAGLLFERELARALNDLEARGELVAGRSDVEQGWLTSSGTIQVAPALGEAWQLELSYEARHGILSTRVDGEFMPRRGPHHERVFGDLLSSTPPHWTARYLTLSGTLDGSVQLAPFIISQGLRELDFQGGHLAFGGEYGDWRLRARLSPWRLTDGKNSVESGPISLESRYTYTDGAHHFTQYDDLHIERLVWHQPDLDITARDLVYRSLIELDDRELSLESELQIIEILAADKVLLSGSLAMEVSRVNADAVRGLLAGLRDEAAMSDIPGEAEELLVRIEPAFIAMLQDSPRLDVTRIDLESPMLGLTARGEGALFFDARRLDELSLVGLGAEVEQVIWLSRLDGDFIWHDVPTVVALWLGLPLGTEDLEIDVARGQVRVNGRPLPPHWRQF